jgi:hypothetical protein
MGPVITASNGRIRRAVSPIGASHVFNFILGMRAVYKAHFTGVIYKNNTSDPTWKWESFVYAGFNIVSGALPANATPVKTEGGVSTVISGDKKIAQCSGYVQIYFSYTCVGLTYNGIVNNCYVGYNYHANNEAD